MVRKLVESDEVLMIFQLLGTPTNIAIQKYLNQKQIPQLFIFSGASRFGDPKNYPWTMGWQPDYATEGGVYAKHILASVKDARIGILFQNDDSGKDGVIGFQKALGKQNEKMIVAIASYEVTDPTVDSQIIQLKNCRCQRIPQSLVSQVCRARDRSLRSGMASSALSHQPIGVRAVGHEARGL